MNLLSRYIVLEFLRFFFLFLTAFVTMTLVGNFFNNLGEVFQNWQSFLIFLKKTALLLPQLLELTVPVTILLATISAFSSLNRTSELVAMRSSGMSTLQMLFPIFGAVFFIACASYLIQHPIHNWMQNHWSDVTNKSESSLPQWKTGEGDQLYYLGSQSQQKQSRTLAIFHWTSSNPLRLLDRTLIQEAVYQQKQWSFQGIQKHSFESTEALDFQNKSVTIENITSKEKLIKQVPSVASESQVAPHYQPFFVLYANILRLQKEGQNVLLHQVELYQKLAYPIQLFIMALIGISLALPTNRKGKGAESLAISGFLGIIFWMLSQILFALAASGLIPPLLGAWGGNLLFFLIACALTYSSR